MIMNLIEAIIGIGAVVMIAKNPGTRRGVQVFFKPDGRHRLPQD
jgi:hypothetical protein